MKVPKVIYKKNFVIGKNLYEHFTMECEPDNEAETPEILYDKAKEIIEKQHLENQKSLTTAEVIQRDVEEWDKEYAIFKQWLMDCMNREDAEEYLKDSKYYDVLELKLIVKNKPSKYE